MGSPVLFDTNYYIYAALGLSRAQSKIEECFYDDIEIIMPQVVRAELFSSPNYYTDTNFKDVIDRYISWSVSKGDIIPLEDDIILLAGEVRVKWNLKNGKKLPLPDALIGATAVIQGATLYSNNERDFSYYVENHGLKLENLITDEEVDAFLIRAGIKKTEPDYLTQFKAVIDKLEENELKRLCANMFGHLSSENKKGFINHVKKIKS